MEGAGGLGSLQANASKKHYIALLGFGSANQELAKLIIKQRSHLQKTDPTFTDIIVSGIFTGV